MVTRILREGNQVANLLANYYLSLNSMFYCQEVPDFILDSFVKNKLGWTNFRIS